MMQPAIQIRQISDWSMCQPYSRDAAAISVMPCA